MSREIKLEKRSIEDIVTILMIRLSVVEIELKTLKQTEKRDEEYLYISRKGVTNLCELLKDIQLSSVKYSSIWNRIDDSLQKLGGKNEGNY